MILEIDGQEYYGGPPLKCSLCGCSYLGGVCPLTGLDRQVGSLCLDYGDCPGQLVLAPSSDSRVEKEGKR